MLGFWNRGKSQTSGRLAWAWGLCMYLEPLLSSCIGCLKGTWRVLSLGPVLDACQSIQASTTRSCYTVLFMLYWQMQMVELVSHNERTSSQLQHCCEASQANLISPPLLALLLGGSMPHSLCFWAFGCMLQLLCWYFILHSSDLAMLCPWLGFRNNLWNTVRAAATQLCRYPLLVSEASMRAQSSHVHLTKLVWYTLVSYTYENWKLVWYNLVSYAYENWLRVWIRSMYSRFCRVCGRACGMEICTFPFFAVIIQTCAERMMQPSQLLQHFLQNTNQKCTEDDDGH
jgi:hypothetical protein